MTDENGTEAAVDTEALEPDESEGVESLARLQDLLRQLFQLDLADLDFGIYRLLHMKRDEIEAFLTDQHYVKTGEAFRDYAFRVDALAEGWRVRFALIEATVATMPAHTLPAS